MNRIDVDKLMRAFSYLKSFRENLPTYREIAESYIDDYHERLKTVEDMGIDVEEYKIPAQMLISRQFHNETVTSLTRHPIRKNLVTREPEISRGRFVDRARLLIKVDAILGYLNLLFQEPEKKIGFQKT